MAKITLKFENNTLREYSLADGGSLSIGRMPDNGIAIDNLAISGHHARIYWERDHFAIEDSNSLNGTYVNQRRITKSELKDGDIVLVGKHTLLFQDEARRAKAAAAAAANSRALSTAAVPKLEETVILETRQAKQVMAKVAAVPTEPVPGAPHEQVAMLHIIEGKTDQEQYVLTGKLTVIGKSEMASIKLKSWLAPKVAAVINNRERKFFIAPSERNVKVRVNGADVNGQKELQHGDVLEFAGVKATFTHT